jgi:hypothetical protein
MGFAHARILRIVEYSNDVGVHSKLYIHCRNNVGTSASDRDKYIAIAHCGMIIQVEALVFTGTSYSWSHTAPGNTHVDTDFARKLNLLKEYLLPAG